MITEIQIFLEPVFKAIVNEEEWQRQWRYNMNWPKDERSSNL